MAEVHAEESDHILNRSREKDADEGLMARFGPFITITLPKNYQRSQ
jgi:hypothetical protein